MHSLAHAMKNHGTRKTTPLVLLGLFFFSVVAMQSQARSTTNTTTEKEVQEMGDSVTLRDALFNGLQGIVVEASPDESEARIRLTKKVFGMAATRASLTLRAPLDKETGQSTFASLDGLSGSIAAELGLSQMRLGESFFKADQDRLERDFCRENGVSDDESCGDEEVRASVEELERGKGTPEREAKRLALKKRDDFLKIGGNHASFWSLTGGAGYKNFEFFERQTTDPQKSRETALSGGGALGLIFSHSFGYIRVKWERSFEERDPVTHCSPVEGSAIFEECKSLPFGAPEKKERLLATLGWRYIGWTHLTIDPQISFDSKDENFLVELPVYLIRNEDRQFTGGLSLGWDSDSNDFVARVFVTQPLGFE